VLVIADEGLANFVVVEEFLSVACVFAGNLIDFLEDADGAEGDVFEIADGGADEVQAAQGFFIVVGCESAHVVESSTRSEGGFPVKEEAARQSPVMAQFPIARLHRTSAPATDFSQQRVAHGHRK
jgi:hypothetical protein